MPDEYAVGPAAQRHHRGGAQHPVRGIRPVQHQRRDQRGGDQCTHRGLDRELLGRAWRQPRRSGQRRSGYQVGAHRDDSHQHPVSRQPMRPPDRAVHPLGEQHAGREPGEERRRPGPRVEPRRCVKRNPPPKPAGNRKTADHRHPGAHRQPPGQQRKDRQGQIEGDLHRQAPHLRQPGGQRQRHIDLGQRQVCQPYRQAGVFSVGQQSQNHHDGHHVRRHDAHHPRSQIVTGRRAGSEVSGRRGVAAPQQESRQREEHRDREIKTSEQPTVDPAGMPRLKRDVRDDHADGRACPHALDGGQERPDPADLLRIGHDDSLPGM